MSQLHRDRTRASATAGCCGDAWHCPSRRERAAAASGARQRRGDSLRRSTYGSLLRSGLPLCGPCGPPRSASDGRSSGVAPCHVRVRRQRGRDRCSSEAFEVRAGVARGCGGKGPSSSGARCPAWRCSRRRNYLLLPAPEGGSDRLRGSEKQLSGSR